MENTNVSKNRRKRNIIVIVLIILLVVIAVSSILIVMSNSKDDPIIENGIENNNKYQAYQISNNSLEEFDLYFLQLQNNRENKVYSPLSLKYALSMLKEGTNGETKQQITNIIGDYNPKKYVNSKNMSFANVLFIRDSYKDSINQSYIDTLSNKYNAEVIYDLFNTPDNINSWVKRKTLNLIDGLVSDVSDKDFVLLNALAIDMEWKKQIQSKQGSYSVEFDHEDYNKFILSLMRTDYHALDFAGVDYKVKSVEIGAVINKYDIVNTLGEDKIRETVRNEYNKWVAEGKPNNCGDDYNIEIESYLDDYIKSIDKNYKHVSSSTDFYFYTDSDVKVFAKDLKEYDGTTLQYVGIMPIKESLETYIGKVKVSDINTLINNLKTIEYNNFKDGVITEISGYIPMFDFKYEMDLVRNLQNLGITDVFLHDKADLSNLTKDKAVINSANHKANIEFSNDGIKAAAVVELAGAGGGMCGFDYLYDVPVEKIDLTFDKPYLFLIRDVKTGEVWFTGTVYEPVKHQQRYYK